MDSGAESLKKQADKCRMLAQSVSPQTRETLLGMARQYDERAQRAEREGQSRAARKD